MPPPTTAVAIVTDTTGYCSPELFAANSIHEVSLYITGQGGQERESTITDLDAYYGRLHDLTTLPTTSQPSIGDFLEVYEPLADAGQDIISVHLSGGISGTVQSARQAADDLMQRRPDRRVVVIDSGSGCCGLAFCALAGASAASHGDDVDAVAARVRDAVRTRRIWFAVDTLEYLRRGGRIGTAQAWLGGALKIKPILTLDGEITPVERVRTSGRAFARLLELATTMHSSGTDAWAVQHIQAPDQAQRLAEQGEAAFGTPPMFIAEIGPVIGTHVGPGLLGIGGLPVRLLDGLRRPG